MLMTLKALSALLCYPTKELQEATDEIRTALQSDNLLSADVIAAIAPLLDQIKHDDIYDQQESYVGLFDRSRTLSLNLFEHVHGDGRDRGGAMVDLLDNYRDAGFEPATTELPDHLPVLLEFLAMQGMGETKEILADAAHILEALKQRLERRESLYAGVFAALLQLSGQKPDTAAVIALMEVKEDDPDDLEALDEIWEESEVTFGPDPNAGCPQVRDMLANMDTPATGRPVTPTAAE
jgi:nitrate reductase delta subunit